MNMKPVIEIANRSTDKSYGVTRYLVRFTTEIVITDIDRIESCAIPPQVIAYIKSTLIS